MNRLGLLIAFCCMFALGRAGAAEVKLPDFQTITLDNGATLLLTPRKDVPLIATTVLVRGGSLADPAGKEGVAELTAGMLEKGAGDRNAAAFAEAVDNAGGSLSLSSTSEAVVANAQFLSKDSTLMLSLLSDALQHPRMDAAEFDKLRKNAIDSIATAKDSDPRRLVGTYADAWLFQNHPYGRAENETSLANITLQDLQEFRRLHMGGNRLIISIAGDFDSAAITHQVQQLFGHWAAATGTLPTVEAKQPEKGRRVLLVDKPGATQTYFSLLNVGTTRSDPARAAQNLVQTAFGGRFTSMLNTELRVKSGLTYGATSRINRMRLPGDVNLTSFTKTEATQAAIDLAIATLDKLHQTGLDAATLQSAKNYIAGQFPPSLETSAQVASSIAWLTMFDEPRSSIDGYLSSVEAATPAQVAAARAIYPQSKDLVIVAIGDASAIRPIMQKYGPVTEIKLSDPRFSP